MTLAEKSLYRKPTVVLREESDEWSLLFDPDTGKILGIDPVGTRIWKEVDGSRTMQDIFNNLKEIYQNVPDTALDDLSKFIGNLAEQGMIGYHL